MSYNVKIFNLYTSVSNNKNDRKCYKNKGILFSKTNKILQVIVSKDTITTWSHNIVK